MSPETLSQGVKQLLKSAQAYDEQREKSKIASANSGSQPKWRMAEFLDASANEVIIKTLTEQVDPQKTVSELAFASAIGQLEGPALVEDLLRSGDLIPKLATTLHRKSQTLTVAAAATGEELNDKFAAQGGTFQLNYGTISDFSRGLEFLIGPPEVRVREAMASEHCSRADSDKEWVTSNYGIATTPRTEWHFVADPTAASLAKLGRQRWPEETKGMSYKRSPKPRATWVQDLANINSQLHAVGAAQLIEEEYLGGRLYTGPMFEKYNAVNRGGAVHESITVQSDLMKKSFQDLCLDNHYQTTVHVINSALIKLTKLSRIVTVYRGLSGGVLPECFWKADCSGARGGVEFGFMSTTTDRSVAMRFANRTGAGTILEMTTGAIDRGADLSWLSQYPLEHEVCFPPLTSMEVTSTRVEGSVLVVGLRLNINFTALTIEEVISKRKKILIDMTKNLTVEIHNAICRKRERLKVVSAAFHEALHMATENAKEALVAESSGDPDIYNDDATWLASIQAAMDIKKAIENVLDFVTAETTEELLPHSEDIIRSVARFCPSTTLAPPGPGGDDFESLSSTTSCVASVGGLNSQELKIPGPTNVVRATPIGATPPSPATTGHGSPGAIQSPVRPRVAAPMSPISSTSASPQTSPPSSPHLQPTAMPPLEGRARLTSRLSLTGLGSRIRSATLGQIRRLSIQGVPILGSRHESPTRPASPGHRGSGIEMMGGPLHLQSNGSSSEDDQSDESDVTISSHSSSLAGQPETRHVALREEALERYESLSKVAMVVRDVRALISSLGSDSVQVQRGALVKLCKVLRRDPGKAWFLAELAAGPASMKVWHRDDSVCLEAINAIRLMGGYARQQADALVGCLNGQRPSSHEIRVAAVRALSHMGSEFSSVLLTYMEDDPFWEVRHLCIESLSKMDLISGEVLSRRLQQDPDPSVRVIAAQCLLKLGSDAIDWAPVLARALSDPQSSVRIAAARALGGVGISGAEQADALGRCLRLDDSEPVRLAAAVALASIGRAAASQVFILGWCLAKDPSPELRAKCAKALGELGSNAASQAHVLDVARRHDSEVAGDFVEGQWRDQTVGAWAAAALQAIVEACNEDEGTIIRQARQVINFSGYVWKRAVSSALGRRQKRFLVLRPLCAEWFACEAHATGAPLGWMELTRDISVTVSGGNITVFDGEFELTFQPCLLPGFEASMTLQEWTSALNNWSEMYWDDVRARSIIFTMTDAGRARHISSFHPMVLDDFEEVEVDFEDEGDPGAQ